MPKLKSNRAAAKRFRVTGSGKPRRRQSRARHHLLIKSRSRKRRLGKSAPVSPADAPAVLRLLGLR
jgi:large subunit ribosomal protein L35